MAEVLESPVIEAPVQEQQIDMKALEALVFNEPIPQPNGVTTPIVENPETPAPVVETPAAPVVDYNAYVKEHFGFESVEEAKAQLESLRKLKDNPPAPQIKEFEFANEDSKKIAALLKSGDVGEDQLAEIIIARKAVRGIETKSAEDQLKLYIQLQNPLFDKELIEDEYNSLYKVDETKLEDDMGNVDPLKLRKEKLRADQRIQNDVKKASEFFAQYKTKIELPDITPVQSTTTDESYETFKASTAKAAEAYNNVVVPSINSVKEENVGQTISINDPNKGMVFDVAIQVDKADLDSAKQKALNFEQYLSSFYDDKGNLNAAKMIQFILRNDYFDKYSQTIATQAVNAERKAVIAKETPNGNGGRDFSIEQTNELKELEKLIFPNQGN